MREFYTGLGRSIPHPFEAKDYIVDQPYFTGGFVDLRQMVEEAQVILDAGSGAGELLCALAEGVAPGAGKTLIGADYSPRALELARERRDRKQLPVAFLRGDMEQAPPLRDGMFDLIISHETIEHLVHPADYIRNLARLLRPGGRLILVAPTLWFRSSWPMRIRKVADFAWMMVSRRSLPIRYREPNLQASGGDVDAVYLTSPYEVARAARLAGLTVEKLSPAHCRMLARKD